MSDKLIVSFAAVFRLVTHATLLPTNKGKGMWSERKQPFVGRSCVTSLKTAARETNKLNILKKKILNSVFSLLPIRLDFQL